MKNKKVKQQPKKQPSKPTLGYVLCDAGSRLGKTDSPRMVRKLMLEQGFWGKWGLITPEPSIKKAFAQWKRRATNLNYDTDNLKVLWLFNGAKPLWKIPFDEEEMKAEKKK